MNRWICLKDIEIDSLCEVIDADENYCLLRPSVIEAAHKTIRKLKKSKKRIKIRSAKSKGRNLQKFVCERVSSLTGLPFIQDDDDCNIHSREMGQSGLDVILRGDAKKKFQFSIECKSAESFNMSKTIAQVKSNQAENTDWLIVYKKKMLAEPIVIMEWAAFEKLIEKK